MGPAAPLGERIALHRRRRGLSQVKLAGLVGRSESWLSQVERGVRPIDRITVLAQVARALNIPLSALAPGDLWTAGDRAEQPVATALREALTSYRVLDSRHAPGNEGGARGLSQLRTEVDAVWDLLHQSRFADLGRLLPTLMTRTEAATHVPGQEDRRAALGLHAETYQVASAVLAKLSETDMAWVAGDRALLAARESGDPLQAAASAFRIGHALLSGGRPADALRVATTAATALEPLPGERKPEIYSLWGGLHLLAAMAATRADDAGAALQSLRSAEQAAAHLAEDRNDFHTEFGPTNVALHVVAVSVELGDAGEALRRASTIDAAALSEERRARFLIDVARAYGQRRKTVEALRALLEAEALTPEQVRSHDRVRELVRDLLRGEGRQVDPKLRGLAGRSGVLP